MKKYTVFITSFLLVFALVIGALAETVGTEDRLRDGRDIRISRRTLLHAEKNPCGDARGLHLSRCLMEFRRSGSPIANTALARPLSRSRNSDRRATALLERAARKRSVLVPRTAGTFATVDLEPGKHREPDYHGAALRNLTPRDTALGQNQIQSRARSGVRKVGTRTTSASASGLLCARRHGIRLLSCLQEFSIQISPKTVDKESWGIWETIQGGNLGKLE